MKTLKEEALAAATVVPVILVGSLAFVTVTMPFVFPLAVVGAIAVAARRRTKAGPRNPVGRPPRRARSFAESESPGPLAA